MITLGIETSCDETAVAVVSGGKVLSSEISSSVHLHAPYGGIVPEIASRFHVEYIWSVFNKALRDAKVSVKDIELVAVTDHPGLPGSLLVGEVFARAIGFARSVPVIGVDHLNGHLASCFIEKKAEETFPFIGAVVSGGHTSIYYCQGYDDFLVLGRTKDDAAGEAFDKVAKMLDLGYPGGPVIEEEAKGFKGKDMIVFPRALLQDPDDLDFSFSGIKTAVMYYWRGSSKTKEEVERISHSFQEAVVDVIDKKITRAIRLKKAKRLAVGGGVTYNKVLRRALQLRAEKENVELFLPAPEYCTDNAAMIAFLGEKLHEMGKSRII